MDNMKQSHDILCGKAKGKVCKLFYHFFFFLMKHKHVCLSLRDYFHNYTQEVVTLPPTGKLDG